MILPIRTSILPKRTPYCNYALIALNVVIFFITLGAHKHGYFTSDYIPISHWAEQYMLWPDQKVWYQYITYAFLHSGYMHIIGNMFFLYLFGNNVNDKLGTTKYLLLYFAGAVAAALGQVGLTSLTSPDTAAAPLLGASGAVAAVTGAYFVLFPQTYITVIYWFFFIGTFEVPALYFILFKLIIYDNLIDRLYYENIAYEAHLAGYAFGIALVFVFLLTKLVSSSGYDLLDMAKQWNRRRRFRDIVASGYDPFAGSIKKVKANSKEAAPKVTADTRIADLRGQISEQIAKQTIAEAARLYLELMGLDKEQLLPQKQLLDIANQLAGQGQYREAAYAYDQFISHYNSYEYIGQVQLMLGLIYSRYLNEPELAVKVLQIAEKGLGDPAQLQMCKDEIEKLKNPDR